MQHSAPRRASALGDDHSSIPEDEFATPARSEISPLSTDNILNTSTTVVAHQVTPSDPQKDDGSTIRSVVTSSPLTRAADECISKDCLPGANGEDTTDVKQVRFNGSNITAASTDVNDACTEASFLNLNFKEEPFESAPLQPKEEGRSHSPPSDSSADKQQQRGLVSRRGRYVSPGIRSVSSVQLQKQQEMRDTETGAGNSSKLIKEEEQFAIAEYKTFRSPARRPEDEVPSLCSAADNEPQPQPPEGASSTSAVSCDQSNYSASPLASSEPASRIGFSPPNKEKNKIIAVTSTPTRGDFQTLPSLDDGKLMSPGGAIFLSPSTPSRTLCQNLDDDESLDDEKKDGCKSSPRDREHCVATPTDFALDYGKNHAMSAGSFDTSNVLAWLQSPTANGLFSPGGYASILNTPGCPRTPRTPTVSTSFFFSDVASLPRGDNTPGTGTISGKGDESSSKRKGISNIICISPLASSKARNGVTPPVNLKDVFASPQEKMKMRSLPLLQDDTPGMNKSRVSHRNSSKDPSLDAVHLAERDLMEDEDMSVLLQLASNTPRSATTNGSTTGPVFRSPNANNKDDKDNGENLPALQLPMIGGQDIGGTRLQRKHKSRISGDADDAFVPPQLGMRSGTAASKEIVPGGRKEKEGTKGADGDKSGKMGTGRSGASPPYPMHPSYHRDNLSYYPMPPGGMPPGMPPGPGGSMRVVVGGPPPNGTPPRPGMGTSPHAPPPHYPEYPYPPPPPGMYPQFGPPPMGYPYQGHYPHPPPRHLPVYGAQQPQSGQKPKAKVMKNSKTPNKRTSPVQEVKSSSSKKQKKSPSSASKKKKNLSPPLDGEDLEKAAATVHAVNAASGGKNDRAAALAAAILRGVTMRPSGKWQAQLYFAGKSRYIGVFDTREKAALAYEIAREKLKSGPQDPSGKSTENLVNAARKAAFEGVNEKLK